MSTVKTKKALVDLEAATETAPRQFVIRGGRRLTGTYPVQGNKNAALPLIAATLLAPGPVTLKRVPRIRDVMNLLRLLRALGAEVEWDQAGLHVDPRPLLERPNLPDELVKRLRGGILLLGALAQRYGDISCAMPGGCPIGRRSFEAHWSVLRAAGFEVDDSSGRIELSRARRQSSPRVFLKESSVTGTENALLLFASMGAGRIENPAREPHVIALIEFLRKLGCDIETHPLYFQVRSGIDAERGPVEFEIPADYIDAGTMAIAAAATDGHVVLEGVTSFDMLGIRPFLEDFGVIFEEEGEDRLRVRSSAQRRNPAQLTAGLWPLFPTDLISLAIVLAVKSQGLCLVHDWMYEARMFFVDKLVRMGAKITLCDPHRVMVEGAGRLKGITLESPDIRAGMALVVAGLCAEGTTTIEHAEVIQRGYEDVIGRLRSIGADIA
ncbi:MAG TPA: UDP-N-acetylglucosamine 1-carboxyvinyltransferase [Acidobacteriota bacterium]|nr:UDP-N-acetylglucosamine 1-carboxyvinyltransferase [Acidobacteriota bacterium]